MKSSSKRTTACRLPESCILGEQDHISKAGKGAEKCEKCDNLFLTSILLKGLNPEWSVKRRKRPPVRRLRVNIQLL